MLGTDGIQGWTHTGFNEVEAASQIRIAHVLEKNKTHANATRLLYRRNRYKHLVTDHGDLNSG